MKGKVLLDTGSARSVIYTNYAKLASPNIIKCSNESANGVSGSVPIEYKVDTDVQIFGYHVPNVTLYAMDTVPAFFLGNYHE